MKSGVHLLRNRSIDNFENCVAIEAGDRFTSQSLSAFQRLIEYHRAAFDTKWHENQLLNLWAALEGFLPAPPEGIPRIDFYQQNVLPAACLSYIGKLAHDLANSLFHTDPTVKDLIKQNTVGENFIDKCLSLLTCDDLKNQRLTLYSLLGRSPLLRYRCHQFHEQFATSDSIERTLLAHQKRVSWHLHRIYTSRNQIVHNARSLPYLATLVQNFHSYIDLLVEGVTSVVGSSPRELSVASALKIIEVTCKVHRAELIQAKVAVTSANYVCLLLGTDNPFTLSTKNPKS